MDRFDLRGALAKASAPRPTAYDLDDVLAGTWVCERVRLGTVPVLVRATSYAEVQAVERSARLIGQLGQSDVGEVAMRLALARAVLDPASTDRRPLFDLDQLASLPRLLVEDLAAAHHKAQARIYPALDERQWRDVVRLIGARAALPSVNADRIRVRHCDPAALFGVPPVELTTWQLLYFEALSRS